MSKLHIFPSALHRAQRARTILWDKTGKKFGKGKGLFVFADGKQIAHTDSLHRIKVK